MTGGNQNTQKEPSPKPWKQKLKKAHKSSKNIEIFEGKPTVTGPLLEATPANEKFYLRILCKEEVEFFVPAKVVGQLKCVDIILHGEVQFKEKLEKVIRFPDFRAEVLESVFRFVFLEYLDNLKAEKYWGENAPRVTFQFGVEPGLVMELVYAAHFFGIRNLLNVAAAMIAHHLRDVPDVSSMPPDLAWCVAEQFSAQDLFYAEERDDFLSLNLDTSSLWEKHCRKLLPDDATVSISSLESYPPYEEWVASEGPPATSWKSLFISVDLQQLADRQNGSTNEAFMKEVASKGKWAHTHTIRSTFWEWVMSGQGSLSFDTYSSYFSNLFSLCLTKVPLGDNGAEIGKLLQKMESLQILDISETGFTKEAAGNLGSCLQSHCRLQILRAAYNRIGTEGFTAIARALQTGRSLRVLDVRENGIAFLIPQDAVEAIKSSHLEELLLDGNCKWIDHHTAAFSRLNLFSNGAYTRVEMIPLLTSISASLKCLQLQQCELGDAHISLLAQALKDNFTIQKIDLSDNRITSDGASAILLWMQENTSLLELSFANNNVTDGCSTLLCVALHNHPLLEKFSLMGNYSYGEEYLPEVIQAAVDRGNSLMTSKQKRFMLDLRSTDVSYANRARLQRQAVHFTSLHLLI